MVSYIPWTWSDKKGIQSWNFFHVQFVTRFLLPILLTFYVNFTFTCYKGEQPPLKTFLRFSLYCMSYFPWLLFYVSTAVWLLLHLVFFINYKITVTAFSNYLQRALNKIFCTDVHAFSNKTLLYNQLPTLPSCTLACHVSKNYVARFDKL